MDGQSRQTHFSTWTAVAATLLVIYGLSWGVVNGGYTYDPGKIPFGGFDDREKWISTLYLPMGRLAASSMTKPILMPYLRWCRKKEGQNPRFDEPRRGESIGG